MGSRVVFLANWEWKSYQNPMGGYAGIVVNNTALIDFTICTRSSICCLKEDFGSRVDVFLVTLGSRLLFFQGIGGRLYFSEIPWDTPG